MATISKSKNLAAGVGKTGKKAPMVDPKGAYTKVQQRTLGNMKKGGKLKKGLFGLVTAPLLLGAAALKAKGIKKKVEKEAPKIASIMTGKPMGGAAGMKKGGKIIKTSSKKK